MMDTSYVRNKHDKFESNKHSAIVFILSALYGTSMVKIVSPTTISRKCAL